MVVASGAIERPLIFRNNDLPGIMQGSCAQQLVHTYGLAPGKRAVISGCHDGLLEVAHDLAEAGVHVAAVAEARKEGFDPEAANRIQERNIPFLPGHAVAEAGGFRGVQSVSLQPVEGGSVVVAEGEFRGKVCTCRYSPTLKASIGMALVDPGLAAVDGFLEIYRDVGLVKGKIPEKRTVKAKVVSMPFYDPKGERLRR